MQKKTVAGLLLGALLVCGLAGCSAEYEGTGSKDAATAEQLAMTLPDQWDDAIEQKATHAEGNLKDGTYTGVGHGVDGLITVTIEVKNNVITTTAMTQEGETQSIGGFEGIRDGKYAALIDAAQGPDIDTIAGATFTTAAVREAVEDALAQAKGGN